MARAFESLAEALGAAVGDVRQKVVEEGTYGRAVTPRPLATRDAETTLRSLAEAFGWEQPHTRTPPSPEHGIDR